MQKAATEGPIKFYTTKGEFGFCSNFSRHKVFVFGREWMTSEHAYQAQKFLGMNQEDYDAVFGADRPMVAADIGRDRNRPCRPDWDQAKDDVMRLIVLCKFVQNDDIREQLLSSGDRCLIEHDSKRGDKYWADGGDGSGKNMLGVILMEVREVLCAQQEWKPSEGNEDLHPVAQYICSLKVSYE